MNINKKIFLILSLYFSVIFAACAGTNSPDDLVSYIGSRAKTLSDASDLEDMLKVAGQRKLVLLGEASHGTHEYYAWRDSISRRLIEDHGFDFIAVEGDWASIYELNRYVKDMPGAAGSARQVLEGLERWPLWMWGNEEVLALAEWLRDYNDNLPLEEKVGFYGKDVYDEWNSFTAVLEILRQTDIGGIYSQAADHYSCLEPYRDDIWEYARNAANRGSCEAELEAVVELIREAGPGEDMTDEEFFYLKQNALVVKHAEKFYRKSVSRRDQSSWNSRVNYMKLTVDRLLGKYGPDSQGIVWAHNTHVGDARFTEMYQRGQENIGQLARVDYGPENVFLVGFSTYRGSVKAGSEWGSDMQIMNVPRAMGGSLEALLESTGMENFMLVFDDQDRTHQEFMQPYGHRAIGVVYNPGFDRNQYVQSVVPLRYDVLIFFRETKALSPIIR